MEEAWGFQIVDTAAPWAAGAAIMTVAIKLIDSIERIVRDVLSERRNRLRTQRQLIAQVESALARYERHIGDEVVHPARQAVANLLCQFSPEVDGNARAVIECMRTGQRGKPFIDCRDRLWQSLQVSQYKCNKRLLTCLRGPSAD